MVNMRHLPGNKSAVFEAVFGDMFKDLHRDRGKRMECCRIEHPKTGKILPGLLNVVTGIGCQPQNHVGMVGEIGAHRDTCIMGICFGKGLWPLHRIIVTIPEILLKEDEMIATQWGM